jgi:hypothetical protein
MSNYSKLLLAGDIHGRSFALRACFERASVEGCDAVIQLGDFGWWPHVEWGFNFIEEAKEMIAEFSLPLYFLDGNHDNHPDLWRSHTSITPEGFHVLSKDFFYIPRGLRFEWSGVTFLALGGGFSIDKDMREPGKSWWPTELLSQEEIFRAIDPSGPSVDIVLSHECPEGVNLGISLYKIELAEKSRKDVRRIVDHTRPHTLFHGHYHIRRDTRYFNPHTGLSVEVFSLAHQEDLDGMIYLLDLEEWKTRARLLA